MMLLRILIALTCLLVSGCAAFVTTKADLLQTGVPGDKFCYSDSLEEASRKLRTYLQRCYKTTTTTTAAPIGGVFIPIQSKVVIEVEEERSESTVLLNVKYDLAGYIFSVRLSTEGQQCPTSMQGTFRNRNWLDRSAKFDRAVKGLSVDC